MHQFDEMLSLASHAKCNQSAIVCMAMRHRCILLLSGEGIEDRSCFTQKERSNKKKNQTDAAFTEPDVLYANKIHKQWRSNPSTLWYLTDASLMLKKSAGNSHIYVFTDRRKSSWGANGIIPILLKAMEVIFKPISGNCIMSKKKKGFEVLEGGFFWLFNSHQLGQVSKRAQLLLLFWPIFFLVPLYWYATY